MSARHTKHGEERIIQRSFRPNDPELIRSCGTLVPDRRAEVYLLLNKDVDQAVCALKQNIDRLQRLRGCEAVFAGNKLVTVIRPTRRHEKALLRRAG